MKLLRFSAPSLSVVIMRFQNQLLFFFILITLAGMGLKIFAPTQNALLRNLQKEQGYCWIASMQEPPSWQRLFFKVPHGDNNSSLVLAENDQEYPKPNVLHERIRQEGAGTFSHWGPHIYFSTLDNDDPTINGKIYSYRVRLKTRIGITIGLLFSILGLGMCISKKRFYLNNRLRLHMIFCFIFILAYALIFFSDNISKWKLSPDTRGYFQVDVPFSEPWKTVRTPGLFLYVKALGQFETIHTMRKMHFQSMDEMTDFAENNPEINAALKYIANSNYLLLSISIALLAVALACPLHPYAAILMPIIFLNLTTLPAPSYILADQPASILSILFTAFGLFYIENKKLVFLFLASLCAVYAFLVKPAMIFLPVIAGILIIISFIHTHNNTLRKFTLCVLGIFLSLGTLVWPINLYRTGGLFTVSQISSIGNVMFAVYLLQPGDEMFFSDPADKAFVAELLRQKPEVDQELDKLIFVNGRNNYSKVNIYTNSVNTYYRYFIKILRQVRPNLIIDYLESTKISKSICGPIIRAHFDEHLKTIARSFLSTFSMYPDFNPSPFNDRFSKFFQYKLHFSLFIGIFITIMLGILIGHKPLIYPIIFTASLHPLHVLFSSIGHAILTRYMEISEWNLLLSFMLALWSLLVRIFIKITEVINRPHEEQGEGTAS